MRKTLVTILCSALIAASSIQAAAAAEHHTRKASRKPVMVNDQYRNSNNEQPRDSNVSGTCGLFPGPCQ
jgi:Ni/Co efflux regulator RcnB